MGVRETSFFKNDFYKPGIVGALSTLFCTMHTIILRSRYCYSHFTDEQTQSSIENLAVVTQLTGPHHTSSCL